MLTRQAGNGHSRSGLDPGTCQPLRGEVGAAVRWVCSSFGFSSAAWSVWPYRRARLGAATSVVHRPGTGRGWLRCTVLRWPRFVAGDHPQV